MERKDQKEKKIKRRKQQKNGESLRSPKTWERKT